MTNYIFVTGGVISGLGKGITASSIGKVLQFKGYTVNSMKIDPYINIDAGTLRPTEHGEVWVTEDGGEIDQDLGHYERFLNTKISKENNITTGQIYYKVIGRERKGEYLGKTVQPIPHITDEIKRRIRVVTEKNRVDFLIVEIGGVVGDYENVLFLEAARQMKFEGENVVFVHVAYLPVVKTLGEMKSKPAQHSAKELRSLGIQPDFLVCRSEESVDDVRKDKIALFCSVKKEDIISNPNLENVYELPLLFEEQKFGDKILEKMNMKSNPSKVDEWKKFVEKMNNATKKVRIGIVGKYFDIGAYKLPDSYVSVIEAIKHAAANNNVKAEIEWIDSKQFEDDMEKLSVLRLVDGIIVPGGFGKSGVEGKILAIQYAREKNIPFLGLCFGLQLAVIEFARNVCNLESAHSTEIDLETKHPVIDFLPWQKKLIEEKRYGATMRLGGQTVVIKPNTLAYKLYGKNEVVERFRHRYEINPEYVYQLEKKGFVFSGSTPNGEIKQIGELPDLKYFIGSQFHPEFTSRPIRPNPLFNGLIQASIK